jgi:hypothetical protein
VTPARERQVVAAMLSDGIVPEGITSHDFADPNLQALFAVVSSLLDLCAEPTDARICEVLRRMGCYSQRNHELLVSLRSAQ